MFERFRRSKPDDPRRQPHLSFGSWDDLEPGSVVQVCHPDWRGVRTVTYSFHTPVVECDDPGAWSRELTAALTERSPQCVVIQGWPPGAGMLAAALSAAGVPVKTVLHSSPAQHDAEVGEAKMVDEIIGLVGEGVLAGMGMAKAGVPEAITALGIPVAYVPNRAPVLPSWSKQDLGTGFHVGVFAEPFWRKNVSAQVLAASLMGATPHVMRKPDNRYMAAVSAVEHGQLGYPEFISLQASVDLNLYVTLSECHPSTPQESYLTGVPCLMSRTSSVFRSDPDLWQLTTVDQADNPSEIAAAARRLDESREEAVARARVWIDAADRIGAELWESFVSV